MIPGSESPESQISKHASRAMRFDNRSLPPTDTRAAGTPERPNLRLALPRPGHRLPLGLPGEPGLLLPW